MSISLKLRIPQTPRAMVSIVSSAIDFHLPSSSEGCGAMKPLEISLLIRSPMRFSLSPVRQRSSSKRLVLKAAYGREAGRPSSASIFVGGFVLGGLIVGALGCIYAPQISKVLAGTDRKDLMRKLPKFIYDEEKALEKTRRILEEKIEQLNSAIDDVSSQLRADEAPNGTAAGADEIEAAM